jgi:hypothetical protein
MAASLSQTMQVCLRFLPIFAAPRATPGQARIASEMNASEFREFVQAGRIGHFSKSIEE